jgi:hypothetical protein
MGDCPRVLPEIESERPVCRRDAPESPAEESGSDRTRFRPGLTVPLYVPGAVLQGVDRDSDGAGVCPGNQSARQDQYVRNDKQSAGRFHRNASSGTEGSSDRTCARTDPHCGCRNDLPGGACKGNGFARLSNGLLRPDEHLRVNAFAARQRRTRSVSLGDSGDAMALNAVSTAVNEQCVRSSRSQLSSRLTGT